MHDKISNQVLACKGDENEDHLRLFEFDEELIGELHKDGFNCFETPDRVPSTPRVDSPYVSQMDLPPPIPIEDNTIFNPSQSTTPIINSYEGHKAIKRKLLREDVIIDGKKEIGNKLKP